MRKNLSLKYLFVMFALCLLITNVQAQNFIIKQDTVKSIRQDTSFIIKHSAKGLKYIAIPDTLRLIKLPNSHITNPAFRYTIGNIELSKSKDEKLNDAVSVLLDYVRNDSVRHMVNYIKTYIKDTDRREKALKLVKQKIRIDSIDYETNTLLLNKPEVESYYRSSYNSEDLGDLVSFVEKDSVYMWMKEVSRDSVLLSLKNSTNDSINLWVNSKKVDFYRFWIKNSHKDSIGAWIQTIPGKSLKIIVDDDVYQESLVAEKKAMREVYVPKKMGNDFWNLEGVNDYDRYINPWKYSAIGNLGFTQGFLENWSGGGESSISGLLVIDAFANYKKGNLSWDNKLSYRYGIVKTGEADGFRKNEDLLDFETKVGIKAFKKWYYSAMFNLKTQFFNGYNYPDRDNPVSAFLAPGNFIFSAGMDYKPSDDFTLLISPITGKFTVVVDTNKIDQTKFGIEKDKKVKEETGAYIKTTHKWEIDSNIKLVNEVGLFTNYHTHPENVDINWQMTLEMRINYFIATKIFTHMIYDKDVIDRLQFKEILNVGISYRF